MAPLLSMSAFGLAAAVLSTATFAGATSGSYGSVLRTNPAEYLLSSTFNITDKPQTRYYDWTASNITAAPDGYFRNLLVINNQLPGPLIEANDGDTIVVKVTNQLTDGLTIHWHGLYQNGTNWMDGVASVTQCPIPPGKSFTYRYQVNDQFGTFFWHAHSADLNTDGLRGPLIVHSTQDPLKRGQDYDRDQIIFTSDWYHNLSDVMDAALATPQGYHNDGRAPNPDAALINGIGECDQVGCTNKTSRYPAEFVFPPNTRTRIRLVNGGNHAMMNVSVDDHKLNVVEADGTGILGLTRNRVALFGGQRYSAIVTTTAADAGKNFWFRANMMVSCLPYVQGNMNPLARAIIRVPSAKGVVPTGWPTTSDWNDGDPQAGICQDPDPRTMVPSTPRNAGQTVVGRGFFRTMAQPAPNQPAGSKKVLFYANNISFTDGAIPLLHQMVAPGPGVINSSQSTNITYAAPTWYDLVIVNEDLNAVRAIHHPYHLHSLDMYIVAQGTGNPTNAQLDQIDYNWKNPLRRDTVTVPGGTWLVARVDASIAGIWLLHCHIGFHLAEGMAGVIIAQPDKIRQFQIPPRNRQLCQEYAASGLAPKRKRFINDPLDNAFLVERSPPQTFGAHGLRPRVF